MSTVKQNTSNVLIYILDKLNNSAFQANLNLAKFHATIQSTF